MRLNPEYRRYVWMEMSGFRVVGMPIVLGGIFLLFAILTHEGNQAGGGADMYETLAATAASIVILIGLFWGTRLAASALVQEIADKTWDAQRLSSLGPWAMAWGKLAGSTVYAWYGIWLSLIVLIFSLATWESLSGGAVRAFGADMGTVILQTVIGLVAFTVLVQATALVAALTAMHRRETTRRFDVSIAQVAALVVAIVILSMLDGLEKGPMHWFGYVFEGRWFAVASVGVFAAWAVIGVWRRMQLELQVRIRPVIWPVFVIFTACWMAGFVWPKGSVDTYGYIIPIVFATLVIVFAGYVPALFERLDPVRLRHLVEALKSGRLGSALGDIPLWLVNHLVAFVAVAAMSIYVMTLSGDDPSSLPFRVWDDSVTAATVAGTVITLFLFVTRDLLLLAYAYLGRTTRRAVTGWLIWLAILYVLIPAILSALGMFSALPVFVPVWDVPFVDFGIPPVVWPLVHIAIVSVLLTLRWRRFSGQRISSETPGEAQSP